ncbi:MAG: hypothetical protein ACKO8U_11505, partial [Pirellula sp.]
SVERRWCHRRSGRREDQLGAGSRQQRVQYEKAPFDHPWIRVVNGSQNSQPEIEFAFEVPAVGAGGHTTPPSQFPSSN